MESKTKELVKAGHELVVLLGTQHGMIDAASLVQRLTAQLDITAVALREKSKQCDASEQAERVWEITMMQACGEDGPKSVADKFAALEAERDALANELAAVQAIHNDAVFITDEHYDQCPKEVQKIIGKLAVMLLPTTDAFLREQMAKGVDMFSSDIGLEYQQLEPELKPGSAQAKALKNIVFRATSFAQKLRGEVKP